MLEITERLAEDAPTTAALTLPFEIRQKSRFRAALDDGRAVGVILERGRALRHGEVLRAADGTRVRVQAAPEAVSTAYSEQPLQLARACYHLGNRHVALQIGADWVRYLHDHVLDEMVLGLGLNVAAETAPFEPEPGAYGERGGHGHGHAHAHEHAHPHT